MVVSNRTFHWRLALNDLTMVKFQVCGRSLMLLVLRRPGTCRAPAGHLPGTCPKRRFSPWFLGETEVSTMGNSEARKVGEGHFINCDVS